MRRRLPGLAILALLACAGSPVQPAPPVPGRVLFIGNSLTYANDLPRIVAALADSAGTGRIAVEAVTAPDASLGDHWADGTARTVIRRGGWETVVLQQGPSSLDASRADLLAQADLFAGEIRAVGAKPALYSVWPEKARLGVFDRVTESYRLAAERVHGLFLPGGEGWRAAWRRDSTLALYDADDFHPALLGSYAIALVMYGRLAGRTTVGLPARLRTSAGVLLEVPPAVARLLQEAADEANATFPAEP
jgi:hypothetical protein